MCGFHMWTSLEPYFGYDDDASHSTRNLSSIEWAIFAPNVKIVSIQGIFIGFSTNNNVEYNAVVELPFDAILHGIHCKVIMLDSQLVLLQLVNVYSM